MNILFDIYSTQFFIGGGAEYVRRVFYSLVSEIKDRKLDVNLFALMDKTIENVPYQDLSYQSLQENNIQIADISASSLKELILEYNINKVFIGIAQYWSRFDIENICVPTICIIHDLCDEETVNNHLFDYLKLDNLRGLLLKKIRINFQRNDNKPRLASIVQKAKDYDNFEIITVSEYSRSSLAYYYSLHTEKIQVLYSPERILKSANSIINKQLKTLIDGGERYYLMLNANRILKNSKKTIKAFQQYLSYSGSKALLVTTGLKEKLFDQHVALPYLDESDLEIVLKNCYAFIFPSIFEGFGYPPIEAMKYGKPVFASNVSSIPEICGDAPLYFSPFYASDIFRCLMSLNEDNYTDYSEKSMNRYRVVNDRQNHDLQKLVNKILR